MQPGPQAHYRISVVDEYEAEWQLAWRLNGQGGLTGCWRNKYHRVLKPICDLSGGVCIADVRFMALQRRQRRGIAGGAVFENKVRVNAVRVEPHK